MARPVKYPAQAQYTGTMALLCPYCGRIRDYALKPGSWRFRCKYNLCKQVFYYGGMRLYVAGKRKPKRPRDHVFPYCAVVEWQGTSRQVEVIETGD